MYLKTDCCCIGGGAHLLTLRLLMVPPPRHGVSIQRGRPPFPVERRPNSLVCASFNPSLQLGKERVEASGSRRPGAMDSSVGSFSPRAPETVQVERRLAWRTIACPPKDQPRSLLRLLEQGPESQSASTVCWGGVSSVMGSSDLDAHRFVPSGHKVIGIKAHCLSY